MITVLRRRFKKYGFQIVLWVTMISMFIAFVPSLFDRQTRENVIATVNGFDITSLLYGRRLQQEHDRIAMLRQRFGPQADMYLSLLGLDNPEQTAYDGLVQEALVDHVAKQAGLSVDPVMLMRKTMDPQFIMQYLTNVIPAYVLDPRTGTINPDALQAHLQRQRMSHAEFEAAIERALSASTVMGLVATSVSLSPDQLKDFYERTALGRKYGMATFSFDQFVQKAKETPVTDEQLTEFFTVQNAKNKKYWVPEKRSGMVWQFTPEGFGITVSDAKIQAYYDRNKHKRYVAAPTKFQMRRIVFVKDKDKGITDELRQKAQKVHEQLTADPAQFAQLAKQYSQDKNTAAQGGLSKWLTREQISSDIRRPLFRLKEDGAISDVITTEQGLEIVQRVGRKSIQFKELDQVKESIATLLKQQQFKNIFEKEARKIIRQANNDSAIIKQFIADKGGTKQQLIDMPKGTDPMVRTLFLGKEGSWHPSYDRNTGMIVQVSAIAKRHQPELAAVKEKVTKDYYEREAQDLLAQALDAASDQVGKKPLDQLASDVGATYQETPFIKQDNFQELQKLSQKGIPVSNLLKLSGKGAHSSFKEGNNGYLAQVLALEPFEQEQFEAKKQEIAKQLYQEEIERKQRALVASLYRNATIKTSDKITQQAKA